MLEAKFKLNGSDVSRLVIGNRSFPAFSGYQHHANLRSSQCLKNEGPIPVGKYYIVERTTGTLQKMAAFLSGKSDWFALLAIDEKIDDFMKCQKIVRGQFRLHPKGREGISLGCVTMVNLAEYNIVHSMLKAQPPFEVGNRGQKAYGILKVY